MSPLEQKVADLERKVRQLEMAENVSFIEQVKRRLGAISEPDVRAILATLRLNDLADVDVPSPSNGQVLKYTTSGVDRWIAGTDNTS